MKILHVVGARPNFMKIDPVLRELSRKTNELKLKTVVSKLVHTGQHYDYEMSKVFFDDFDLPKPDYFLNAGSGSHAEQTAKIMVEFERVCLKERPDLVSVVGDVNSTLACSITAKKLTIKVVHIEAGLRSGDLAMPEEVNRIVTDSISDYLFASERSGVENLRREGKREEQVFFVGNVMIDTLMRFKAKAREKAKIKLNNENYALLTLHRPSNVDDPEVFGQILEALQEVSGKIPILFPSHPRTQKQIKSFHYEEYFYFLDISSEAPIKLENTVNIINPLSYLEFLNLMSEAKFVLTDSGGIQEETTILGVPCLTLRENTERPVTLTQGTNTLVGNDRDKIREESFKILEGKGKKGQKPELWDGKASERIVDILLNLP